MSNSLISRGAAGGTYLAKGENRWRKSPASVRSTDPPSLVILSVKSEIYSKRNRNVCDRGDSLPRLPIDLSRGAWILGYTLPPLVSTGIRNSRHRVAEEGRRRKGGRKEGRWSKHRSPLRVEDLNILRCSSDSKKI